MKKLILVPLIFFNSLASAEPLTKPQERSVEKIIAVIKTKDPHTISQVIDYPLKREIPLKDIANQTEFKKRFTEVFDEKLLRTIANSDLKQWQQFGWRGISLNDVGIWVNDVSTDTDTQHKTAKIFAINYSTQIEKKLRQKIIDEDKRKLHPSLQKFSAPELKLKTNDYLIRIDQLGKDQYRYAAWKGHQDQSKKPDLVLKNGKVEMGGSGGDHQFVFKNGAYHYIVHRSDIGTEEDTDAHLIVQKNEQDILNQSAQLVDY